MSLSLYEISVPPFIRALGILSRNLDKGRRHADEQGIDHAELLGSRLYPDMLPLIGQVQRASDTSKFVVSRVAGVEAPAMPDTEASFGELHKRIEATIDFLKSVEAGAFDGRDEAPVVVKLRSGELTFTGRSYVMTFATPNLYFHVATAYGIMRHRGVPLGKADFLGGR